MILIILQNIKIKLQFRKNRHNICSPSAIDIELIRQVIREKLKNIVKFIYNSTLTD